MMRRLACLLLLLGVSTGALAQGGTGIGPPRSPSPTADLPRPERPITEGLNPLRMIGDAAALLPGTASSTESFGGFIPGGPAGLAEPAEGVVSANDRRGFSVALNIMVLLTVLTLVPSVMLMTTCFVRILIVLALLRQAIGTQTVPPAQIVTGLAMFMTVLVMSPTIDRVWEEAVVPWQNAEIDSYDELWDRAKQPIRDYMFDQIEATGNWSSVYTFLNYKGVDTSEPEKLTRADVDLSVLVPAYMLSELKVGFLMGFRVYLPFLVIDMVIASVLISMSMMMLPPVLISLPFKLLLFVMVDGWSLVTGSLLESFATDGMSARLSGEAAASLLLLVWVVRQPPGGVGPSLCGKGLPRDR